MLHEVLTISTKQDVHISCPADLVEPLVTEFEQQLADTPSAEVYDYGISLRFQQGFLVVSFDGCVPADFLAQLDADPRLEGRSLYDLPAEEPVCIARRTQG